MQSIAENEKHMCVKSQLGREQFASYRTKTAEPSVYMPLYAGLYSRVPRKRVGGSLSSGSPWERWASHGDPPFARI